MADPASSQQDTSVSLALPGSAVVEPLGQAAKRLGFVTEEQVAEAAAAQSEYAQAGLRKKIGEVMVERRQISSEQLELAVKNQTVSKKRIGDYELISKLGEGGMGAVYKARQMSMDRIVAVKVLSQANAKNQDYRTRFESEARAVARLNHPNIVMGIDAGHSDGFYYFAMEFVDGDTLGQLLMRSGGKLPEREALKYIRQIALALKHAHENNLLHRDVKPDNILIDKNRNVAKLADLGLARDAVGGDCGATRTGQAVGTPFYMSPEQARGKDLSPATDFYSLGGTLYHLLTGQIPFSGASAAMIMARHITDPIPNPRILEPKITSATAKLVVKCLQKDPADRFKTADDLILEIDRVSTGTKVQEGVAQTKSRVAAIKSAPEQPQRDAVADAKTGTVTRKRRWRKKREDSSSLLVIIVVVGILAAALIYAVTSSNGARTKKNPQSIAK